MHCITATHHPTRHIGLALRGLILVSLGLYSMQASAIAKCRQPDGSVIYQNMPCGTSERGEMESTRAGNPYSSGSATQNGDVIHKLIAIKSALDPLQTALTMYVQERGYFPGKQEMLTPADSGRPFRNDSIWGELGFSVNPSLPNQVASLTYIPLKKNPNGGATSFALVIAMTNVDQDSIDGTLLSVSPSPDVVIKGPGKARSRGGNVSVGNAQVYYYSCYQQNGQPLDPAVSRVFGNPDSKPLMCR